jgi:hypothetical protein
LKLLENKIIKISSKIGLNQSKKPQKVAMASAVVNHETGGSGLIESVARKQIKVDSSRQTNILRIKARKAKVSGMEKKKNNTFFWCIGNFSMRPFCCRYTSCHDRKS